MDAALPSHDQEFADRIDGLYAASKASGIGSAVASLCLVVAMSQFTPLPTLAMWLAITLVAIGCRLPLLRGHAADNARHQHARQWARLHTAMMVAIGLCWSLGAYLLMPIEQPLAVATFLIILALTAAGSVASQSYHLPAVNSFLSFALLPVACGLALLGTSNDWPIAATVGLFYVFMLAYARVQSRQIGAAIHLKHENAQLADALRAEKEQADALRIHAEQANRAKSQFLAAASHDLRQPMHALGLFAAALHEMAAEPDKRAVVQNILNSIDALESLFTELLDLSRLDAGATAARPRHFALKEVLDRLQAQTALSAFDKGLALRFDDAGAIACSDPALLERLLGNLVANAIRYTAQGGVSIAAIRDDARVAIEVRDTGIGIPQQHRERIFDEFFQIGNAERDRRKGLGLGLAIVRRLTAILGHELTLDSTLGRGSCFTLWLPAGDPTLIVPAGDAAPFVDTLSGKRVLVIDDERDVLSGMQALLGRWGCEVWPAADAREATLQMQNRIPDLIIADLRLRDGVSGIEAIDDVRRHTAMEIPALVITGDMDSVATGIAQFPVLHKPVRPVQLRSALSQLLAA